MKDKFSDIEIKGLLGPGSRFEGVIRFEGAIRIDGVVYGKIICKNHSPSMVIITELAVVEGDIVADVVVIAGMVSGNIKAIERLELRAPGRFEGLVYSSDLSIQDGALFQGECVMIRQFSEEDKKSLKMEGFYNIHHQNIIQHESKAIDEFDATPAIKV
ncbi:MAG: polymer-forming cytoskeletal protein [Deltaproteobacteria bacterium]|nr:polymer-forming cytoskeletal protein [Deltaproteobacteria bacterium]